MKKTRRITTPRRTSMLAAAALAAIVLSGCGVTIPTIFTQNGMQSLQSDGQTAADPVNLQLAANHLAYVCRASEEFLQQSQQDDVTTDQVFDDVKHNHDHLAPTAQQQKPQLESQTDELTQMIKLSGSDLHNNVQILAILSEPALPGTQTIKQKFLASATSQQKLKQNLQKVAVQKVATELRTHAVVVDQDSKAVEKTVGQAGSAGVLRGAKQQFAEQTTGIEQLEVASQKAVDRLIKAQQIAESKKSAVLNRREQRLEKFRQAVANASKLEQQKAAQKLVSKLSKAEQEEKIKKYVAKYDKLQKLEQNKSAAIKVVREEKKATVAAEVMVKVAQVAKKSPEVVVEAAKVLKTAEKSHVVGVDHKSPAKFAVVATDRTDIDKKQQVATKTLSPTEMVTQIVTFVNAASEQADSDQGTQEVASKPSSEQDVVLDGQQIAGVSVDIKKQLSPEVTENAEDDSIKENSRNLEEVVTVATTPSKIAQIVDQVVAAEQQSPANITGSNQVTPHGMNIFQEDISAFKSWRFAVQVAAIYEDNATEDLVGDLSSKGYSPIVWEAEDHKGKRFRRIWIGLYRSGALARKAQEYYTKNENKQAFITPITWDIIDKPNSL